MAQKPKAVPVDTNADVVDELHPTVEAEGDPEFVDVTGKDDLPAGVADPAADDDDSPAVPAKPAAKPTGKKTEPKGDEIPVEYSGKTMLELAKMLKESQSLIGRQGQELGELRKAADTYIKDALTRRAPAAPAAPAKADPPLDDVDFFTNPREAIAKAVENHPSIKALQGTQRDIASRELTRQRQESYERFNAAHPDAAEISRSAEFREWVLKSPIRQAMVMRAHQHYDLAAGMEVFNTWKELQTARASAQPAPQPAPSARPVASRQAARVPTGGNPAPRTPGAPSQKIYRRADVIRLMETDPARYELMSDEITKAYQEGRVR